jgi:hypothetical protein
MKSAVELLDVIESSSLPLTDKLLERREDIVELVDGRLQQSAGKPDGSVAADLADLLIEEGVVIGDTESVQDVIAEYLHVVADEAGELGDEEKNFLDSFLK